MPLNERAPRWLLFLGTWALTVYLIHQPILLGAMTLLRKLGA
jgi:peptidoglycan/LPS O-acetylase OafA/YrhL